MTRSWLYLARVLLVPSLVALLCFAFVIDSYAGHVEHIEDYIIEAIDTYATDPVAAKEALYSLATDPDIPEACALWADANLAALVLIDSAQPYGDSWALYTMFEWSIEAIPVFRNDCLLAL